MDVQCGFEIFESGLDKKRLNTRIFGNDIVVAIINPTKFVVCHSKKGVGFAQR